ncbi:MAG: hypothetical protein AMJ59_09465 [Gammaproteobacteria bacterium SG8_31]|nr:MAG: hypothetical protein AMJ59_09465 [Gammaproteobacteria bacterium SG8_31]
MVLPFSVRHNMPNFLPLLKGLDHRNQPMPGDKPELLKDLLTGSGGLAGLVKRAAATDRVARRVQSALPAEVSEHVVGANIREKQLVVIVDGAAWAARVRFEASLLKRALAETGDLKIERVSVRVRPPA